MKICSKCKETKQKDQFEARRSVCKKCRAIQQFERRSNNNSLSIYNSARNRARKNNIPFNITLEDIVIPTHCPILGIELVYGKDDIMSSPSLDKINPSLGYTKGNIIIISMQPRNRSKDYMNSIV